MHLWNILYNFYSEHIIMTHETLTRVTCGENSGSSKSVLKVELSQVYSNLSNKQLRNIS